MKVGDNLVVSMGGFSVAQATIEAIEGDRATIYIPATRVVMGIAHSLTDLNPEVDRVFVGEEEADDEPVVEEKPVQVTDASDDVGDGMANVKLDSSALD